MAEDGAPANLNVRGRHIKKRALKDKSLSLSFNEKDLSDFVTGFHKRKKKRRKEALQKQEEAARRARIEARKKMKLNREHVMSCGAEQDPATDDAEPIEEDEQDDDDDDEPVASVSGMTMYDNGDTQVTVTTSEIVANDEVDHIIRPESRRLLPNEGLDKKNVKIPIIKKPLKKAQKRRSRAKPQKKRDKKKGKKKNRRTNQ